MKIIKKHCRYSMNNIHLTVFHDNSDKKPESYIKNGFEARLNLKHCDQTGTKLVRFEKKKNKLKLEYPKSESSYCIQKVRNGPNSRKTTQKSNVKSNRSA